MTRAEKIDHLRIRYLVAVSRHKRKAASLIYARLRPLVTRQLKAETRERKHS